MKTKVIFACCIFIFKSHFIFSQITDCSHPEKIRGPLIINDCNGNTLGTLEYYLQNNNVHSMGINWIIGPISTLGTITPNSTDPTKVNVDWAPNAVALGGYLAMIPNGGGDTDTLWPQNKCCSNQYNYDKNIVDLDDNFLSITDLANEFINLNSNVNIIGDVVEVMGGTFL
jgi:hypothetical protein